jgi:hypothetical protein
MKNLLLAGLLVPVLALANDGMNGVAVGGIVLNNTDRIALKKQVISISRAMVSADYELLNESPAELEETITFPLPEYKVMEEAGVYSGEPNGLMITADGKPVLFKTLLVAKFKDAAVTNQLRKIGLTEAQIVYNPGFGLELAYNPLTPAQIQQLSKLERADQLRVEAKVPGQENRACAARLPPVRGIRSRNRRGTSRFRHQILPRQGLQGCVEKSQEQGWHANPGRQPRPLPVEERQCMEERH